MRSGVPLANTTCPRCGYDLRGIVESWQDQCDLSGTCTECGLPFRWADLLSAEAALPRWCVEFGVWATFPKRFLKTTARAFWPWSFWGSMEMFHETRWRRIAAFLLVHAALIYATFCASHGWTAYSAWKRESAIPVISGGYYGTNGMWVPISSRRASRAALKQTTFVTDAIYAALLPWNTRVVQPWAAFPTANIPELATSRGQLGKWDVLAFTVPEFAVYLALCGAGFAALPTSRRRAKVQWHHIFRITSYGAVLFVPLCWLNVALTTAADLNFIGNFNLIAMISLWIVIPYFLFLQLAWWSSAIRSYLKIPHAPGVAISLVIMATLGHAVVLGAIIGTLNWLFP